MNIVKLLNCILLFRSHPLSFQAINPNAATPPVGCHDVEFENLLISLASSKAIDRPGVKVLHYNQGFSGNSAKREAGLNVPLQYPGIGKNEDRIEGLK